MNFLAYIGNRISAGDVLLLWLIVSVPLGVWLGCAIGDRDED